MIRATFALLLLAAPAAALDIELPATARLTVERNTDPDLFAAPVSVFASGQITTAPIEGSVRRSAWRVEQPGLTPLQVMRPLRSQLEEAGYEIVLDCEATACGGFDFRFAVETLPGPNMYVNIRAYHYVTALRKEAGTTVEAIGLLTSTAANAAYIQIIQAGQLQAGAAQVQTTAPLPRSTQNVSGNFAERLLSVGHAVLNGVKFGTGETTLGDARIEDLDALAAILEGQPGLRVALVGHTDSVGSLEGNIAISRRRAQAVRQRLIDSYGANASQIDAQGMGYLAPVANNLDEAGRETNRRVEVILLSAQ